VDPGKGAFLKRFGWLVVLLCAALGLVWLGRKWWPNDESAIRTQVTRLMQAASVRPSDSGLARLAYADRLAGFFTTNVAMHIEGFGSDFANLSGRTDLVQAAMAARMQLHQAEFTVADLDIKVPEDHHTAIAYATVAGQINSNTNGFVQALKMTLQKSGGRWLIAKVDTVPGLH
jgi:hypothetical protein